MGEEPEKSEHPKPLVLDHKDIKILAAQRSIAKPTHQKISDKTGIPRTTVADRLSRIRNSDVIQQAQIDLQALAPDCVQLYAEVIRPKKDKFGVQERIDLDTRLTVADRILRGTGTHVEKNRQERSEAVTTADGLYAALESLSTYELNRFISLWQGEDPTGPGDSDVVDGTEPSPDASGSSPELQA